MPHKYGTLFVAEARYDGLRYSFLAQLCGDAELQDLPQMMLEQDFDALADILDAATRWLSWLFGSVVIRISCSVCVF